MAAAARGGTMEDSELLRATCEVDIYFGSSPEFELGESAVKRRRTKKKKNKDPACTESCSVARNSPSIDLNKCVTSSQCSSLPNRSRSSPTPSLSESSSEVGRTIEIGKQVGFQVEVGNGAVLEAFNGGGAKIGKP
ncbi:hypothetical protein L1887_35828 [Cichorium endivia]|nr:hypothetical protein L1887_35828 [Cichorium endivia]